MLLNRKLLALPVIISVCAYLLIGYHLHRTDFCSLFTAVTVLFGMMAWMFGIFEADHRGSRLRNFQLIAVLLRLVVLFHLPNLSDDFYRFLWDGYLTNEGINPYLFLPGEVAVENLNDFGVYVRENLNSPNYFSVYPPLNQWLFSLAVFLGGGSITGSVVMLKLILFLGEIGVILLLPKVLNQLGLLAKYALIYLLNPLVIIEVIGNCHFEGLTAFFILLTIYWYYTGRLWTAAMAFGMAVGVKLIPLIFVPLIIARFNWKKSLLYLCLSFIVFGIFFILFVARAVVENIFSSLDLYFHSFEFNAGLYYLLREIGLYLTGYNQIAYLGTALALSVIFICFLMAYQVKTGKRNILTAVFLLTLAHYLFSTTVHPWYLINVLVFGVLSGYWRTALVWTFVVFLSYEAYSHVPVTEHLYLLALEYAALAVIGIYEYVHSSRFSIINDK